MLTIAWLLIASAARSSRIRRSPCRVRKLPIWRAGVGRWHGMSGKGCAVVDTDDAKALYAWVAEWSEFLPLETTPVLEDADAGAVLGSIFK